mmetsp:Transcript_95560/g.240802  ORF Transcript_95560/g.240802 Transcript_95560/m.240802 type:complete len:479 (+) Transcript_95560:847-2283(+)
MDMLETAYTLTDTSRLGCQVKLTPMMDGVELTLPSNAAKGLVRMTPEQPRPKVSGTWSSVPAVVEPMGHQKRPKMRPGFAQTGVTQPSNAMLFADPGQDWERLYHEQSAKAAFLEQQLQEVRAKQGVGVGSRSRGRSADKRQASIAATSSGGSSDEDEEDKDDLKKLKEELERTIVQLDKSRVPGFDDVVGLDDAKRVLRESVLWPALGPPGLFQGIRGRRRGVLLYGPPGCGKTMVARAAAAELCGPDGVQDDAHVAATFFHVRPSDVMSKFYGDSQKRISALEELAQEHSPAIVFLDEVDTLLGKRDGGAGVAEHHKGVTNALLTWMDGFDQGAERVFFIGATNRAEALDEAALRRFGELAEVGLPDTAQRQDLLQSLVRGATRDGHRAELTDEQLAEVAGRTEGMSGDDVARLAQQAYLEVLRELPGGVHRALSLAEVPPVTARHFDVALEHRVRASGDVYKGLQQRGKKRQAAL